MTAYIMLEPLLVQEYDQIFRLRVVNEYVVYKVTVRLNDEPFLDSVCVYCNKEEANHSVLEHKEYYDTRGYNVRVMINDYPLNRELSKDVNNESFDNNSLTH